MSASEMPLVTIITLSYRKYKYIYEAIDSVLQQDYPNIQYIISDDGAPNCPKENIRLHVKKKTRENVKEFLLLTREKNVGTVKNLNRAIAKAKGRYIIHLSADDVFYSRNVVRRIVDDFQCRKCNMLGTLRLRCNEELKPIRYMPTKFYQRRICKWDTCEKQYEAFVTYRFFEMASGSVLSYTKEYWDKHPFDETYFLWEDGPFIEQYLREGNYLELDYSFPAICYREGGLSTSGNTHPLLKKDGELFLERNYINVSKKRQLGYLSTKLIESYYVSMVGKQELLFRIGRNIKYFYLLPIKLYFRLEEKIVYLAEMLMMKYGIMK